MAIILVKLIGGFAVAPDNDGKVIVIMAVPLEGMVDDFLGNSMAVLIV